MKQIIEQAIRKVLKELKLKAVKFTVEHPANPAWGDYSTNCGIITGETQAIVKQLKAEESLKKIISEISSAGPGFVNISIQSIILSNHIDQVLSGQWEKPLLGKKISVEYTDPNPFKQFHIGHLYSNIIGEAVAKILETNGATVWRGNFYGDVGLHVAKSVWGMKQMLAKEKLSLSNLAKKPIKTRQEWLGQGYALGVRQFEADEGI
ncbi:MAG: arginine--tRNA ligase, partial [Candidatus Beckwithbacteria bacterium]